MAVVENPPPLQQSPLPLSIALLLSSQQRNFIDPFPRKIDVLAANLSVHGKLTIEAAWHKRRKVSEIELFHDPGQTKIENPIDAGSKLFVRDLASAESFYLDTDWAR